MSRSPICADTTTRSGAVAGPAVVALMVAFGAIATAEQHRKSSGSEQRCETNQSVTFPHEGSLRAVAVDDTAKRGKVRRV